MANRSSESYDYPSTNKGNERSFVANPRAPAGDDIDEAAGPVASDSLAAESVRAGGGFADNKDSAPLGVRGASSTLANDDTSNADILAAAPSRSVRDQDDSQGVRYPDADQPSYSGTHSQEGYVGGSTGTNVNTTTSDYSGRGGIDTSDTDFDSSQIRSSGISGTGVSSTSTSSGGTSGLGARPYVDQAPGYAADTTGSLRTAGELRPKGNKLVEGGDIPPNRSTFTGDVGGPNDPGRQAEATYAQYNAESGLDAGQTKSSVQRSDVDQGGYENLDSSERI